MLRYPISNVQIHPCYFTLATEARFAEMVVNRAAVASSKPDPAGLKLDLM